MPEIAGEYADRLITVEIRNRGIPIGVTRPLYEAARAEGGGRPLTLRAAEGLVENVRRGDNVFIITGAGTPPLLPKGENDGPIGAAVLARALYRGIGALPIYLVEEHHVDPMIASSEAAGVRVVDYETARERHLGGTLLTAPTDGSKVSDWAATLFATYRPSAVISTERLGPNDKGIIHGATGIAGWRPMVDLSPVIEQAAQRGVFTVGVGDHGNELGFGRIHQAVKEIHPAAEVPLRVWRGMATVVKTDVLVTATMSNWGCYGIEAMLAFLLKQPDLMHTPEMARRIIYACLDADGLEALFCTRQFIVDGAAGESSISVVQMLNDLVHSALATPDSGPAH